MDNLRSILARIKLNFLISSRPFHSTFHTLSLKVMQKNKLCSIMTICNFQRENQSCQTNLLKINLGINVASKIIAPRLSQGINESANFRFLRRLSVIFDSRFLPRLLCLVNSIMQRLSDGLDRKQNHTDSLCRKPLFVGGSLGRKPNMTDSLCRKRKLADSFIPCDYIHVKMMEMLQNLRN